MTDTEPMRGPARMSFAQAKAFVMMFGKYGRKSSYRIEQRSLDAIAESDEGLSYLDWLLGELEKDCMGWQASTLEALQVYLSDPAIKSEVAKLAKSKPRVKNAIATNAAQRERQELWGE